MNEHDSERMKGMLESLGYAEADERSEADLILFNTCSYCIVPSTRGREVSRPPQELVAEVEAMAAEGVREVTLLGQNVNSYGRDLPGDPRTGERAGFAALLRMLDGVEGVERLRYTSPHPKDMREDVIRAHAELA